MHALEIVHRTRYEYSEPVTLEDYRPMFRPRDSHDLRLLQSSLVIDPPTQVRWIHDPFGNSIAIASFTVRAQMLEFVSTIRVEHYGAPPDLPPIEDYARKLPFSYLAEEASDLQRCVERCYPDPHAMVSAWAQQFLEGEGGSDTDATLVRMCKGIQQGLKYAMRFEIGTQPPATTRNRSCRSRARSAAPPGSASTPLSTCRCGP